MGIGRIGENGIMPSINFSVFVDKVISEEKRQTIRKMRKTPIKQGDKLFLYSGLRTKQSKLLGLTTCKEVFTIWLSDESGDMRGSKHTSWGLWEMNAIELECLAKMDGFENAEEMFQWFTKTHGQLRGRREFQVIRW
jgi:hypothetical protein